MSAANSKGAELSVAAAMTTASHPRPWESRQAATDHTDDIAKPRPGIADSVQGDGAERSVAGFVIADALRNFCDQIAWHGVQFGMIGNPGTGHGDMIADAEFTFQSGADGNHLAGGRIAERQRFIEPGHHGFPGVHKAFFFRLFKNLADQVRARLRFPGEAFTGKIDHHAFGAGGYQRRPGAHQKTPRAHFRCGHVLKCQLAGFS